MLRPKTKWPLFRRKTLEYPGDPVGATYIAVAIRNPHQPELVWEGEFLIDTGAVNTLVPRQHLEAIGLVPEGNRVYGLANGREIVMEITGAKIELMDESTWGTVIFGANNVEPLLGVTALESVGIEVDPHNATLNKLPASQLKGTQSICSGGCG